MRSRLGMQILIVVLVIAFSAGSASANHIASAAYTGPAGTGGTIAFDVSADGAAVTRFAVTDVVTTCGTITSVSTGSYAIVDHAFSTTATSGLRFAGTFPGSQQAQGTLSIRTFGFPSCTSADVSWTAATTATPPTPTPGPTPTPTPTPGADVVAPALSLTGSTSQRLGTSIAVTATCRSEACRLTARGTIKIAGATRAYALRGVSVSATTGAATKLRLHLTAATRRAVTKALAKRRRVSASIVVTAADTAGNRMVQRRTIKLRR